MGKSAWNCWVVASILAAALCTAGCFKSQVKGQPKAFNSPVAFAVYAVVGEDQQLVGITPSELPLVIPPCQSWYVEPLRPVDIAKVTQEMGAQGITGLELTDATDADLDHLKGLTGLQQLDLDRSKVTDAGLEHLKGLTALKRLDLSYTKVTDAGIEQLKKSLPNLEVIR